MGTRLLNPFEPPQKVVGAHVNPLTIFVNELVQEIKAGLPYLEALDRLVLFSFRYPYRDRAVEAVEQMASIERDRPYFLWGLAALKESSPCVDLLLRDWEEILSKLAPGAQERTFPYS